MGSKMGQRDELGVGLLLVHFLLINFLLICASDECKVPKTDDGNITCSGHGSKWNATLKTCDCAKHFWGKYCEFGRQR